MQPGDGRAIVLNLVSTAIVAGIAQLADQPVLVALAVSFGVNLALFAALAWMLVRFGPRVMGESPLATRRMVVVAFGVAVAYVLASGLGDGASVVASGPLVVVATAGVLVVLRRTRRPAAVC